jgi:TonB family protein
VLTNQIVPWQGEPIPIGDPTSPLERDRLAPVLAGLAQGPDPIDPRVRAIVGAGAGAARAPEILPEDLPDWLRQSPAEEAGGPGELVIDEPNLVLAIDARASGSVLRLLIDAARSAGVRELVLVGVDERTVSSDENRAFFGSLPYFSHLIAPRSVAVEILVEESLPSGCKDHPLARSYAAVGAADEISLEGWPGKDQPVSGRGVACLVLGADATASNAFRAAGQAAQHGLRPLLATRTIDISAPAPPPPPEETLLGILGGLEPSAVGSASGGAAIAGALPKETIKRVIGRHLNEVKFCYHKALARDPSLGGKVVVRFVISPTGTVQTAAVDSSTMADPEVESCVVRSVRRWRFPQPEGGGIVVVTYPFLFRSSGE